MSITDPILTQGSLRGLNLANRLVMAPLTRARAQEPGDIPSASSATYYAQRATAGLIVTEATNISPQAKGWAGSPGIYAAAQIEGWRQVTRAVHERGGTIFLQLWHTGRASHASLLGGGSPFAPSALETSCRAWVKNAEGAGHSIPASPPRAMTMAEVLATIDDYGTAARHAMEAGFDGVEIHAANGYLPEQFLVSGANRRTDAYGGSLENRARFLLDVVESVSRWVASDRIGVRLSPLGPVNDIVDDDPETTYRYAAEALQRRQIGYLHLADTGSMKGAPQLMRIVAMLRPAFLGPLVLNGGLDLDQARALLRDDSAQLVAFGRLFLANPDLPARVAAGGPFNALRPEFFYGGGDEGYTDYPTLATPSTSKEQA